MSTLLNQASLVMIPSGYKEDTVFSQLPQDGSGDLSFTRASNGTRINSAGLVEVCPWNLVQYSEDFSNGAWYQNNTTVNTNVATAPNGTMTADRLTATANFGSILQATTQIVQIYTESIWVKSESGTVNGSIFGISSAATRTDFVATTTWQRITNTATSLGGTRFVEIRLDTNGTSILIWGAQLNIGSTAKPYFPTTDRLNVPRLTYQNGGGGCPSLLLEKQSTNDLVYSEEFDNAGWSKEAATSTANQTTSPDGTQNADTIVDNSTSSRHILYQQFNGNLATSRTFSLYAKQNSLRYLFMSVTNTGDTHCYSAIFDLQSGTVSATKVNGDATILASIVNAGNGWYRCIISGTMTTGTANYFPLIGTSDRAGFTGSLYANNTPEYSGSGQSIYIWGAQLEASSYATSYIPTTSSSATRVADAMTVNLPNTNMTFTAYLECEEAPLGTTATDWLQIYSNASILGRAYGYDNIFGFADAYSLGVASGTKMVWKQESGSTAKIFTGGALVGTSTTGTYSNAFNRFSIYGAYLNKSLKIKQFVFFDNALTDAECIQLTA